MTRPKGLRMALLALSLVLPACSQRNWRDVSSLEMGEGRTKLTAGTQIRLEPSETNPAAMPGTLLSSSKFKFTGINLDAGSDRDLKTAVTYKPISSELGATVVTLTGTPLKWPKGEKQREIEIAFAATGELSGRGVLYFYLVDRDDACVSNIVEWPMEFTL